MKTNQAFTDYSILLKSGLFNRRNYRIEEYLKNVKSIDNSARKLFKNLNLRFLKITSSVTRYEYDDSDFTAWTLFYGVGKGKEMKEDILSLLDLKVGEKPIFSVSGNGFGTGISITSNLASKYD